MADAGVAAPTDKRAPPKVPKPGQKGFRDDTPGMKGLGTEMKGLGTDMTLVCPWEAFGDMELSDLAKYGIV